MYEREGGREGGREEGGMGKEGWGRRDEESDGREREREGGIGSSVV